MADRICMAAHKGSAAVMLDFDQWFAMLLTSYLTTPIVERDVRRSNPHASGERQDPLYS